MYFCAIFLLALANALLSGNATTTPIVKGSKTTTKDPSTPFYPCTAKCYPYDEDIIWGIADGICLPIQNGCYQDKEDCLRVEEGLAPIRIVTKSKCQKRCAKVKCSRKYKHPVCAGFPVISPVGHFMIYKTFNNTRKLESYSCKNGIPFVSLKNGTCHEKCHVEF